MFPVERNARCDALEHLRVAMPRTHEPAARVVAVISAWVVVPQSEWATREKNSIGVVHLLFLVELVSAVLALIVEALGQREAAGVVSFLDLGAAARRAGEWRFGCRVWLGLSGVHKVAVRDSAGKSLMVSLLFHASS